MMAWVLSRHDFLKRSSDRLRSRHQRIELSRKYVIYSPLKEATPESVSVPYKTPSSAWHRAIKPFFSETIFWSGILGLYQLPKEGVPEIDPSNQIEALTFRTCFFERRIQIFLIFKERKCRTINTQIFNEFYFHNIIVFFNERSCAQLSVMLKPHLERTTY